MFLKNNFSFFLVIVILTFSACDTKKESNDKAAIEQASNKKKKKVGVKKNYRSDGSLLSEISYKDGVKDGLAINYYKNGSVQLKMDYVEGKKNGKQLYYYQDGSLYKTSDYVDDALDGFVTYHRSDGSVKMKLPYKKGKPGVGFEEYATNGDVKKYVKDLKIVVKEKNTVKQNGVYSLYISLSDYSNVKEVYYYIGALTDGKYLNGNLEELFTKNNSSEFHQTIEKGKYIKEDITISAEITSKDKFPIILKKQFTISAQN